LLKKRSGEDAGIAAPLSYTLADPRSIMAQLRTAKRDGDFADPSAAYAFTIANK